MTDIKKVLIVDDDEFVLDILELALKSTDYEAVRCCNGQQALHALKTGRYAAVITDIIMPEKNGVELVNEMRRMDIQTPVIAISGDKDGQKADDNLDFACYFADDILKKPVQKEQLLNILDLVVRPSAKEAMKNL